jgi:hypothetical protein
MNAIPNRIPARSAAGSQVEVRPALLVDGTMTIG